jgi:hypothetical protein
MIIARKMSWPYILHMVPGTILSLEERSDGPGSEAEHTMYLAIHHKDHR